VGELRLDGITLFLLIELLLQACLLYTVIPTYQASIIDMSNGYVYFP